mmetsp:Transcript_3710/g.5759  ORF Transcript_3710/g.5759 Transcript_3710/m.5759 type:complete len:96 (-) Transcript_3710:41-328(-)
MLHRQNAVLYAGAAYEPARNRALYCRVCNADFSSAESLFDHRKTDEHKENVQKERRASYCHVCRKQFTSASQLAEHVKGKVHLEALAGKRSQWKR